MQGANESHKQLQDTRGENGGLRAANIWQALVRRQRLALVVFVSVFMSAAAMAYITEPVYESRVAVEIGKVGELAIEEPAATLRRLETEFGLADPQGSDVLPHLTSVTQDSPNNFLTLVARAHTAEDARKLLTQVTNALIARHAEFYNSLRAVKESRLADLESEIQALRLQLKRLRDFLPDLKDPAQATLVAVESGTLLSAIFDLRERRAELAIALSPSQTYLTRFLREPSVLPEPVSPKPIFYLALGAILGLVAGIFAALGADFAGKLRVPH